METFYSILSVTLRPEIDEKLSVGIVLISRKKVLFYSSSNKLLAVKKLISPNVFNGIKHSIKLIEKGFKIKHSNLSNPQQVLELNLQDKSDVFNYNYIDYLSRYNNNIITFSKPVEINVEYSIELFHSLIKKFIDEEAFIQIERLTNPIDQFKNTFYPKVKSYFNIEKEIDSVMYPKLIMPIKIDILGKNEGEVFAQSIDMTKNLRSIENGIADLLHIHMGFPDSQKFILASEPDKSEEVKHRVWNNVRNLNEFDYVDIKESERIEEYAKTHGVVPLFDMAE